MALYRTIHMSFWSDPKVVDDFTPEDKYFYLYLMTNPYTNMCGCYEISVAKMSFDTGYTKDTIERLIKRFEEIHQIVKYSKSNKEMYLLNWSKYNWQGGNQKKPLVEQISKVKTVTFRNELIEKYNAKFAESPLQGGSDCNTSPYEATVTVTVTDSEAVPVTVTDSGSDEVPKNYEDVFEDLWSLYPKKRGRSSVNKKSKEKIFKIGYDHMARAIDRYKAEIKGKDEQYIMIGSTFFNGRYEDYLDENYEKPKTTMDNFTDVFQQVAERYKYQNQEGFNL